MNTTPLLDSNATSATDFGTIAVRVVVLPKLSKDDVVDHENGAGDADDELLPEEGKTPISSYLEKGKGGRLCCVFLVNGQRQEGLDNAFIVQELEFKYLRTRMMVVVEMDGLRPESLSELMQGSRQSFFKGRVWHAVYGRLIATLKNDPELKHFQHEAEAEAASLKASDAKVREALDALIDAHHTSADHLAAGAGPEAGLLQGGGVLGTGALAPTNVVALLDPEAGMPGDYPVLVGVPSGSSVRMRPGDEHSLVVRAEPAGLWSTLEALTYHIDGADGLVTVEEARGSAEARYTLRAAAEDDGEAYPVNCTFRVFARFAGHVQARQLSVAISVKPEKERVEPDLKGEPTFLRVTARQPVRLWNDGDTHVRLEWDGMDELGIGTGASWRFGAQCISPAGLPLHIGFSQPRSGRFAAVVATPPDASLGDRFEFIVMGVGPEGRTLSTTFAGILTERKERQPRPTPEPRVVESSTPAGGARRPPYDPKTVNETEWDTNTCWDSATWNANEPAAYQDPTASSPLLLILNEDYGPLKAYRQRLVAKKLAETDIQARLRKYETHMYYHLWQMYRAEQARQEQINSDTGDHFPPTPTPDKRAEAQRVALTLIKIMEVAR